MPRYFLKLSYQGTHYSGWQIQDNAVTVQEKVNDTLSLLLGQNILTTGCGRTDAGVHARQFYAHFDVSGDIADRVNFVYRMNAILPPDIAVEELIAVEDTRHARYDATQRTYEYFVTAVKNPFLRGYSMYSYPLPDAGLMNSACRFLLGTHDFSSFSKTHTQVKTNFCTVSRAQWETRNSLLVLTVSADRFLRGMVRALVGSLLEIGHGRLQPGQLQHVLTEKSRSAAGVSAPACGLYLTRIDYPYLPVSETASFPG